MRSSYLVAVYAALTSLLATPALAIVGGEIDGEQHPNVGMFYFTQDGTRFRCSGTLVCPTVVLTAAHCTAGSADVQVTFDSVAQADPSRPVSPGDLSRFIAGTAFAHPDWNEKLQLKDLLDIGVVVLDVPASVIWPGIAPAPLPTAGLLDELAATGGLKKVAFEVVGYGVYFGGGTCFGDSGGALLLDGLLVGDTSWGGASQWCSGGRRWLPARRHTGCARVPRGLRDPPVAIPAGHGRRGRGDPDPVWIEPDSLLVTV